MPRQRKIATCDAETDPFLHGRIPVPFIWGYYDGTEFRTFKTTKEFVDYVKPKNLILYAHNGGKFDFMFLLDFIGETKAQIINGRIVSMFLGNCELRDSFAAVPEALKNIKKIEIDITKLEKTVRAKHMPEIIRYLKGDCVYLFELMDSYRKRAGTARTIASNALKFSKKLGVDPGKTSHRFDSNFRDYYFGGRTECFQPGTHKDIHILDIHSAYPFAMIHDHATGELVDFHRTTTMDRLSREELQRAFIVVECDAQGCFPIRGTLDEGLMFPHARNTYYVTGWEYVAAKELGLIHNEKIIRVEYSEKTINFKPYVDHWYAAKLSHSGKDENGIRLDPINYTIDKIMMNSLYGKLSQNIARYSDYKIVPGGTMICHGWQPRWRGKDKKPTCKECGQGEYDHGWKHVLDFGNKEVHSRPSLWRHQQRWGDQWEGKRLYKNVASGASVTGFCRAYLLRAMHAIGIEHIIYTDTDSLIMKATADLTRLPISDALGAWGIDDKNAPIGHFNGKKLYGILQSNGKHKIASKGSKITFNDMERLAKGETITWKSPAPSFSLLSGRTPDAKNALGELAIDKLFVVRRITSTAARRAAKTT